MDIAADIPALIATTDIKDIVVIVDRGDKRPSIDVALDLAMRTRAHVTGLSLVYDLYISSFSALPADILIEARQKALDEAEAADRVFQETARRAGVSYGSRRAQGVFFGDFTDIVRQSRLTDLVVIGQPDPDQVEPLRDSLLEAFLFGAGAPVLIVPFIQRGPMRLDRAVIAWDGGAEAARAVRAAFPLLARASTVEVVMVDDGGRASSESGVDIGTFLSRHGLKAAVKCIPREKGGVAEALLNLAADRKIDWMVMGAYERTRMRETLFGGPTRDIIGAMTIPVLMVH